MSQTIFSGIITTLENNPDWLSVYDLSVLVNKSEGTIRKVMNRNKNKWNNIVEKRRVGRNTEYKIMDLNWRPTTLYPEDLLF